jgi:hypothetical protein
MENPLGETFNGIYGWDKDHFIIGVCIIDIELAVGRQELVYHGSLE